MATSDLSALKEALNVLDKFLNGALTAYCGCVTIIERSKGDISDSVWDQISETRRKAQALSQTLDPEEVKNLVDDIRDILDDDEIIIPNKAREKLENGMENIELKFENKKNAQTMVDMVLECIRDELPISEQTEIINGYCDALMRAQTNGESFGVHQVTINADPGTSEFIAACVYERMQDIAKLPENRDKDMRIFTMRNEESGLSYIHSFSEDANKEVIKSIKSEITKRAYVFHTSDSFREIASVIGKGVAVYNDLTPERADLIQRYAYNAGIPICVTKNEAINSDRGEVGESRYTVECFQSDVSKIEKEMVKATVQTSAFWHDAGLDSNFKIRLDEREKILSFVSNPETNASDALYIVDADMKNQPHMLVVTKDSITELAKNGTGVKRLDPILKSQNPYLYESRLNDAITNFSSKYIVLNQKEAEELGISSENGYRVFKGDKGKWKPSEEILNKIEGTYPIAESTYAEKRNAILESDFINWYLEENSQKFEDAETFFYDLSANLSSEINKYHNYLKKSAEEQLEKDKSNGVDEDLSYKKYNKRLTEIEKDIKTMSSPNKMYNSLLKHLEEEIPLNIHHEEISPDEIKERYHADITQQQKRLFERFNNILDGIEEEDDYIKNSAANKRHTRAKNKNYNTKNQENQKEEFTQKTKADLSAIAKQAAKEACLQNPGLSTKEAKDIGIKAAISCEVKDMILYDAQPNYTKSSRLYEELNERCLDQTGMELTELAPDRKMDFVDSVENTYDEIFFRDESRGQEK